MSQVACWTQQFPLKILKQPIAWFLDTIHILEITFNFNLFFAKADAISCLYVTGPESLTDPESPINTPRIYVTTVEESDELHLIILQVLKNKFSVDSF